MSKWAATIGLGAVVAGVAALVGSGHVDAAPVTGVPFQSYINGTAGTANITVGECVGGTTQPLNDLAGTIDNRPGGGWREQHGYLVRVTILETGQHADINFGGDSADFPAGSTNLPCDPAEPKLCDLTFEFQQVHFPTDSIVELGVPDYVGVTCVGPPSP